MDQIEDIDDEDGGLEIEGELITSEDAVNGVGDRSDVVIRTPESSLSSSLSGDDSTGSENSKFYIQYVFIPFVFLTVALLGGLRIGIADNEFIFYRPALSCLIFASLLLVLFFRSRLIKLEGWFSEEFSGLRNSANGAVLLSLFFASVQVFNSLIPEQGLPFWVIGFCFLWTLWNNLFSEFDSRTLLRSLGGLFGFAFVAKYLVLANLVAAGNGSWLERIWEDPGREAFTYFLNLPLFAPATGYIQFFGLVFYLIGLYFLSPLSIAMAEAEASRS